MSKAYDDSVYGVEKVLTFAPWTLTNAGVCGTIIFTEDIYITELGIMITTALSAGSGTMYLTDISATALASVTLPSAGAAAGSQVRTTTITTPAGINNGNSVKIVISATGAGAGTPYIKYRPRFVSG